VTEDKRKNFEDFGPKFKNARNTLQDKEDPSIYYENKAC
jgi:hypothetical protein